MPVKCCWQFFCVLRTVGVDDANATADDAESFDCSDEAARVVQASGEVRTVWGSANDQAGVVRLAGPDQNRTLEIGINFIVTL